MITEKDIGRRVSVTGKMDFIIDAVFDHELGVLSEVGPVAVLFDRNISGIDKRLKYRVWFRHLILYPEMITFIDEDIEMPEDFLQDQKAPSYSSLENVLKDAVSQSQTGKGAERHANNNNFEDQVICVVGRLLKGHRYAAHAYQAIKKTIEAGRLYDLKGKDAAYNEILGAINYLSALAIMIKED